MARQVQAAMDAAGQRLHREPTEEEIAKELQLDLVEYHAWLADLQGLGIGALEYAGEEGGNLLDYVADDEQRQPSRLLERAELEKLLAEAIEQMPLIDRTVISLYYREELTLRQIAQIVHLHQSRISQLKSHAILRLRAYMERRWPCERGI
jgi:RNA polymerase sigma factor for flagellar operon FliA